MDPHENGAKFAYTGSAHLVLAAPANDERHYHNLNKAATRSFGFMFFMPMWNEAEMLAASKKIGEGIEDHTVKERMSVVGGAPRYVFDESRFEKRKELMATVVRGLSEDKLRDIVDCKFIEMSPTVCERLFTFDKPSELEDEPSMEKITDILNDNREWLDKPSELKDEPSRMWPHCKRTLTVVSWYSTNLIYENFETKDFVYKMLREHQEEPITELFWKRHGKTILFDDLSVTFTGVKLKPPPK